MQVFPSRERLRDFCLVAPFAWWGLAVMVLSVCPPPGLVYPTAWVVVTAWVLGSAQLLWLRPRDWLAGGTRIAFAVAAMAFGLLNLGLHMLLAIDALGGHAAAVEHTARTAGIGWAMYVNYLFAAVWLADVLWLTASVRGYARRPRWVGYAVHGFLAFVVFNATVVYGQWPTRLAGVGWFAILAFSWWRRRRRCYPPAATVA